ncbi:glycosyltransferase family 2 protein [Paracoccus aerodenitrificans]|uniref:glycosyltransferase family 2 protein n=1 Tax=Paracoccus aerodenitrificans TaxID=3017781 RepID=UPI0022F138A5|nr:glycosyltransferase [Paracoccus aerodenitrificans]WBU64421.1 glycosyltransferase [Paracoccus aerodenitrificans]
MNATLPGYRDPVPLRPGHLAPDRIENLPQPPTLRQPPLGSLLLEDGAVTHGNLLKAIVLQRRQNASLQQILLSQGWVSEDHLTRALTRQWRTTCIDPVACPPDARLVDRLGPDFCLKHGVLPWRYVGGVTFIATSRPGEFEQIRSQFPPGLGAVRMLLSSESHIHEAVMKLRSAAMIRKAEYSVAASDSCRGKRRRMVAICAWLAGSLTVGTAFFAPLTLFAIVGMWSILTLLTNLVLKLAALQSMLRQWAQDRSEKASLASCAKTSREMNDSLPVISVMVPLFHESDIAEKLVSRLTLLEYPRELTDILLVVEESDPVTRAALEEVELPGWIRVVSVPKGQVQTKPRALNYALQFCRGDIVGIWDAEDRPDRDQLHKIARGFAFAEPDVACLQGRLDYFNPKSNWLARCFTIEYASWFRVNLPGIARLGLVVPLGGTTVFLRRDVLEQLGGWDAWNVTEDADLGVRLARNGWRTKLIDTTTDEEANCRVLPWVRQRSRWLKGYAMTWSVHMRNPRLLWNELGPSRFLAFQVQFLATLSQYLLAPVLWSFWLLTLGLQTGFTSPLSGLFPDHALTAIVMLFVASELASVAMGLWAVRGKKHRHLLPWIPLMHLYFPLGCLAAWKAIYEVVTNPFYWDKTRHGIFDESADPQNDAEDESPITHVPLLGDLGAEMCVSERNAKMGGTSTPTFRTEGTEVTEAQTAGSITPRKILSG